MRVIAGTAKRVPLITPPGLATRPTTDRIKETLFNMLQGGLHGCHFLDLFSGSGGIGIEALSRGAAECVFVEREKRALGCIRENLKKTRLESKSQVLPMEAVAALAFLEGKKIFDIVFMDPPYGREHEKKVLAYLRNSSLVTEDSLIIVEASKEAPVDAILGMGFVLEKVKEYKTNQHIFCRRDKI